MSMEQRRVLWGCQGTTRAEAGGRVTTWVPGQYQAQSCGRRQVRPGAVPPASRSPARGPPQGSCCLRHGNSIHSRPFSPLPCPGALELRGPGRGDESWRPPRLAGLPPQPSEEKRLSAAACALSRGDLQARSAGSHAPGGRHSQNGQLPGPAHLTLDVQGGRWSGSHIMCWQGDSLPKRGPGNRKGGFRIWLRTLRPAASWRPESEALTLARP